MVIFKNTNRGVYKVQQVRVYKISFFRVREAGVYKVHLFFYFDMVSLFSEKIVYAFFAEMRSYKACFQNS